MQATVLRISAVIGVISRISLWLSGAGLVAMTVLIAWQVWGRYVMNDTPTWTEITSVLLMGWFILLGAAVGLREGNHLSFDVLLYVLPKGVNGVLHTVSDAVVAIFGIGMVVYGIQLAAQTWSNTMPLLGISGGIGYLALICGGVLMVLFALERILRRAVGLPTYRFGDDVEDETEAAIHGGA
ncbi:TRAP transporter small permease subunit [Rhodobacterales bacterium HKCCE2091]|nr:TRAP transporter small permease subunit [Rhodobacterales bacterium HKCCE2091]